MDRRKGLLKNNVVIVTGAAGLLGKMFCEAIIEENGIPILAEINVKSGKAFEKILKEKYGPKAALFVQSDIIDIKSIRNLISVTNRKFGRIDALVNNAYPKNKNFGRKFEQVTYEDFCENINTHIGGYFLISQQVASFFKERGHGNIVNIASIYGVVAPRFEIYENTNMTMAVEYAVIKSSIIHLTKYMAKYFKGSGIRINSVSPGGIWDNQNEKFLTKYNSYGLSKGMLDKSDLKGTLLYLLSDMSAYVNGQNIVVDDGWTL